MQTSTWFREKMCYCLYLQLTNRSFFRETAVLPCLVAASRVCIPISWDWWSIDFQLACSLTVHDCFIRNLRGFHCYQISLVKIHWIAVNDFSIELNVINWKSDCSINREPLSPLCLTLGLHMGLYFFVVSSSWLFIFFKSLRSFIYHSMILFEFTWAVLSIQKVASTWKRADLKIRNK